LKKKFDRKLRETGLYHINVFGTTALIAAYSDEGEVWLQGLRKYLHDNFLFVKANFEYYIP